MTCSAVGSVGVDDDAVTSLMQTHRRRQRLQAVVSPLAVCLSGAPALRCSRPRMTPEPGSEEGYSLAAAACVQGRSSAASKVGPHRGGVLVHLNRDRWDPGGRPCTSGTLK